MKKLKELRKAQGLSQSQLAEKAGTNIRTLQYYEQGYKNINNARIDILVKYCLALDCKLSDLIEDPEYVNLLKKYEA
jgi:transcriptional regulator with XRE-family HTH domain